jgi:hypothetical protein
MEEIQDYPYTNLCQKASNITISTYLSVNIWARIVEKYLSDPRTQWHNSQVNSTAISKDKAIPGQVLRVPGG